MAGLRGGQARVHSRALALGSLRGGGGLGTLLQRGLEGGVARATLVVLLLLRAGELRFVLSSERGELLLLRRLVGAVIRSLRGGLEALLQPVQLRLQRLAARLRKVQGGFVLRGLARELLAKRRDLCVPREERGCSGVGSLLVGSKGRVVLSDQRSARGGQRDCGTGGGVSCEEVRG